MKGLILKDIYNMKGLGKSLVFLLVVFSLAFKDQGMAILVTMLTVSSTVLVVNSLAMDEVHQWYQLAFTMPVTRKQAVLSKYIISVGYALLGIITGICASLILQTTGWSAAEGNWVSTLAIGVVSMLMAILFISVLLPMNFKFGVQKARLLLLAMIALPVLMVTAITSLGIVFPGIMLYGGIKLSSYMIVFGSIAVIAVIAVGSFFLSVRIMEKKEF